MITISFCLFYFFMFQTRGLLVTQRFMLIPILGIICNQVYINCKWGLSLPSIKVNCSL